MIPKVREGEREKAHVRGGRLEWEDGVHVSPLWMPLISLGLSSADELVVFALARSIMCRGWWRRLGTARLIERLQCVLHRIV